MKYFYIFVCLLFIAGCATSKRLKTLDRMAITLENVISVQAQGKTRVAVCMEHRQELLRVVQITTVMGWKVDPSTYKLPDEYKHCVRLWIPPTPTLISTATPLPTSTKIPTLTATRTSTSVLTLTSTPSPAATATATTTVTPLPEK